MIPNRIDKKYKGKGIPRNDMDGKPPTRSACADSALACKGLARGGGNPPHPKLIVKLYLLFVVFCDII